MVDVLKPRASVPCANAYGTCTQESRRVRPRPVSSRRVGQHRQDPCAANLRQATQECIPIAAHKHQLDACRIEQSTQPPSIITTIVKSIWLALEGVIGQLQYYNFQQHS